MWEDRRYIRGNSGKTGTPLTINLLIMRKLTRRHRPHPLCFFALCYWCSRYFCFRASFALCVILLRPKQGSLWSSLVLVCCALVSSLVCFCFCEGDLGGSLVFISVGCDVGVCFVAPPRVFIALCCVDFQLFKMLVS